MATAIGCFSIAARRQVQYHNIIVNWDNIDQCTHAFSIVSGWATDDTPYDIGSIMHYGSMALEPCTFDEGQPMFTTIDGARVIRSNNLSATDTDKLRRDYGYTQGTWLNSASSACYGQNNLNWSPNNGATSYKIEYKSGSNWYTQATTTATHKYLNVSSSRYLRVVGINSVGERSAVSNEVYAIRLSSCR